MKRPGEMSTSKWASLSFEGFNMGVRGRDERTCRPMRKISKKLKRESDSALQRQNNPVSLQGCGNLDHVVLRPNQA